MPDSVRARVGDDFEIALEGRPTTGYRWEVDLPADARTHVELLGSEWTPDTSKAGAPAVQRFRFRALAPGQLTLHFRHRRPWEADESERRQIAIEVGAGA